MPRPWLKTTETTLTMSVLERRIGLLGRLVVIIDMVNPIQSSSVRPRQLGQLLPEIFSLLVGDLSGGGKCGHSL